MSEKKEIKITAAKGRPMLSWVGKRPLRSVTAFPAQHIETFNPTLIPTLSLQEREKSENASSSPPLQGFMPERVEGKGGDGVLGQDRPSLYPKGGLLFHGDNKEVLAHLLANGFRGKVKLIYIDPPFDSGADYVRKVQLRGGAASVKIEGENYALGEQIQYTDIWANDNYLQFMYERLQLLKELLAEDGSIYLHCDDRKSHHLRCIMEELFTYQNEIIWKRTTARSDSTTYNHIHDTILFFSKGEKIVWNKQYLPYSEDYLKTNFKPDTTGRLYRETPLTAPGTRTGPSGKAWKGTNPCLIGKGRHWAIPSFVQHLLSEESQKDTLKALDELEAKGKIIWAKEGEGRPNVIQYVDDLEGVELQSLWLDFSALSSNATESEDYPTQKPKVLLERIIQASSKPGDLILDCFIGSGTTAAVAQKLGRRWIGCDINKGAIQTTAKRLQAIIQEQVEAESKHSPTLPGIDIESTEPTPAQFSFGVWRVNDYDLKIQRNEAVKLACEHIGVERLPSDGFFDGKLGKKLVKIVPFEHPLSPLDLEELRRELEARPDLENTVVFVCLGIELAARTWIEDWNRMRKGEHTVNKIEVIELRTDAKYGNFIKHEPATAKVAISRKGETVNVKIEDFISPTILKRLDMDLPLFKAKITDWRSQVDCVMIDTAYDGKVFNVALSDVPEKKNDLIDGSYKMTAPNGNTTVAVKIVDMLGEEVLITKEI